MKFFVLFVAVAFIASAQALTREQKEKIKVHHKICVEETGADEKIIKQIKSGNFEKGDDKTKSFILCMMKRVGVMNAAGNFLKDVALAKIEEEEREKLGKIIDLCVVKVGKTPEETAWNYAQCFHAEKAKCGFLFDTELNEDKAPVVEEKIPVVVKDKVPVVKEKAPVVKEKVPVAVEKNPKGPK